MEKLIEKTDKLKDFIKCLEVLKTVASEASDHSDLYILKSAETIVGGLATKLADELRYDISADVAESQSYLHSVDEALEAIETEEEVSVEPEEPQAEQAPAATEQSEVEAPAEPNPEIASVKEQAKEFFGNSDIFVEKESLENTAETPAEPAVVENTEVVVEEPQPAVEMTKAVVEEPKATVNEPIEAPKSIADILEQRMSATPAPATPQEEIEIMEEVEPQTQESSLREHGFFERRHTNSDIFKLIAESRPETSSQHTQAEPSKPKIKSIKAATSAANRFIFQRELFGGNGENMLKALDKLDEMDSLQDAMAFIQNELNLDQENRATKELIELVKKRF